MEDPQQVTLYQSQKRPLEDDASVSTPTKAPPSETASTPLTVLSTVPSPSPVKNATTQASPPASSNNSVAGDAPVPTHSATASGGAQQPAKRRKLTAKEKEEKRIEKEAKEKAKAEWKVQKEEEKRLKDEEKRKKNEEREEKKRAKELELQQREEEKRKKERSQLRLNAFFAKPKSGGEGSGNALVESIQKSSTELVSSKPEAPLPIASSGPSSPQKILQKKAQTDYERYFLPFQLPSRAILAPYNRFMEDPVELASARSRLDKIVDDKGENKDLGHPQAFKSSFSTRGLRGVKIFSVADIVEHLNGSSDNPIDLTNDDNGKSQPLELLKQIPMKYLHFPEDVRPPYYGTYTKLHSQREATKLARNPFSRTLHETDYDYDSEAEWEEPEEGEDLDSEGEVDLDEDGEDDMDGFLDDEDDPQVKRRLINGDLEPISTGLCWEDVRGVPRLNDGSGVISTEFKQFGMGFLLEPQLQSIDPFSTAYWAPDPTPAATTLAVPSKEVAGTLPINGLMNPPRLPLSQRPVNGMLNTFGSTDKKSTASASKAAKPPKRMIPPEQLAEFKAEVQGSDLTKIALIEALKKKFPKLPKDAISNTLSSVAARVGAKEVDKRWVLLS
ncbi:hypothetical protein K469DRAFT_730437 [Zopfia rhizophila CBS 207.26]|uniref:Chromatin assembly factor 1 subunit A n=1 Tax=Zopfia rhizophila CBS 207.26 TaxID=1314779 RepID=A0A6A6DL08_9PEZI|nr:hypothetical protein K469DRAFT_730437 [Zopfia rhizophila CBS 207.26]